MSAPELVYTVQLYGGGVLDGQTLHIDEALHRSGAIRVPLPEADETPPGFGVLLFCWDGTVNEHGYARYRCSS